MCGGGLFGPEKTEGAPSTLFRETKVANLEWGGDFCHILILFLPKVPCLFPITERWQ
jgi:hypothetical protein